MEMRVTRNYYNERPNDSSLLDEDAHNLEEMTIDKVIYQMRRTPLYDMWEVIRKDGSKDIPEYFKGTFTTKQVLRKRMKEYQSDVRKRAADINLRNAKKPSKKHRVEALQSEDEQQDGTTEGTVS